MAVFITNPEIAVDIRVRYDSSEFNFDVIVPFVQQSYWGKGRKREDICRAFMNSYCIGFFLDDTHQIAWARATSDTVYHAYIFDLAVLEQYRGKGLGKQLIERLMSHPSLDNVTGWMLSTRFHHDLYRQFGFQDAEQGRYMSLSKLLK